MRYTLMNYHRFRIHNTATESKYRHQALQGKLSFRRHVQCHEDILPQKLRFAYYSSFQEDYTTDDGNIQYGGGWVKKRFNCNGRCPFCKAPRWKCVFTSRGNFIYLLRVKCPNLPLIISIVALVLVLAKIILGDSLR